MKKYVKGFDEHLYGMYDTKFEIGKTYEIKECAEVYKNGFHFCDDYKTVFFFYNSDKSRYCIVEPLGNVDVGLDKSIGMIYCTDKIKIIKEISREEVMKLFPLKQEF